MNNISELELGLRETRSPGLAAAGSKGLFPPCMLAPSLLEAVAEAARNATSGDVALLSPTRSGLDQFRNYQHRDQGFRGAVKSIGSGG